MFTDPTYEDRLEGQLRRQEANTVAVTARRKLAARTIDEDFDGTQVLPSYTEARS